jgi:hypothetical protein
MASYSHNYPLAPEPLKYLESGLRLSSMGLLYNFNWLNEW